MVAEATLVGDGEVPFPVGGHVVKPLFGQPLMLDLDGSPLSSVLGPELGEIDPQRARLGQERTPLNPVPFNLANGLPWYEPVPTPDDKLR